MRQHLREHPELLPEYLTKLKINFVYQSLILAHDSRLTYEEIADFVANGVASCKPFIAFVEANRYVEVFDFIGEISTKIDQVTPEMLIRLGAIDYQMAEVYNLDV